jgi:DNA polymerase-3 subunit epsilon
MILVFDTETTGLPIDINADISDLDNWPRMVQIAWILFDLNGNRISGKDYIIKPDNFSIPLEATEIHNITDEIAEQYGEDLDEVIQEFINCLNKSMFVVSHNMAFDEKIAGSEMIRLGYDNFLEHKEKICTMESSLDFCSIEGLYGNKFPKLSELHQILFSDDYFETHNAVEDVAATAKCFWELVRLNVISLDTDINKDVSPKIIINKNATYKSPFLELPEKQNHSLPQLIPYRKDKLWGFCNEYKRIIVDCTFSEALPFCEKLARVMKKGKYGFINESGKTVVSCKYDWASNFNEGFSRIHTGGIRMYQGWEHEKYGFINKSGKEVIQCEYDDALSFSDGLAAVRKNGKWGFINYKGQEVIPFQFDGASSFKDGLAPVHINYKYGFINKEGRVIIPFELDYAYQFSEGLACVSLDNTSGLINKAGELIVYSNEKYIAGSPSEGMVVVEKGDSESPDCLYGFLNIEWNLAIPLAYSFAQSFSEGLSKVITGGRHWGKHGFINKHGEEIIPCQYKSAGSFHNGLAQVQINETVGYISHNGIEFWDGGKGDSFSDDLPF